MKAHYNGGELVYLINDVKYSPKMPQQWFAHSRINRSVSHFYDEEYNPISRRIEKCKLYDYCNETVIFFKHHRIYYSPIIIVANTEVILEDGRILSHEKALAIRNWQIHTRCFDYMECPFL